MRYVGNRGGLDALVEDLLNLDIGIYVHVRNENFYYILYKTNPEWAYDWVSVLNNYNGFVKQFRGFNNEVPDENYPSITADTLEGWELLCNDPNTEFWFE